MNSIPISAALLRTKLVSGPPPDPEFVRACESGEFRTKRASRGPSPAFSRVSSQWIPSSPRKRPVSPDQDASRRRRRTVGGPSELPERVRASYTQGEQAALAVVVREVMKKGCCDLCLDQIAALAGVGRTTVQNALRKAKSDATAHISVEERPRPGRKNLTNVIRIISKEWVDWLKRRIGFKGLKPTLKPGGRISLSQVAATLLQAHEAEEARPERALSGRAYGFGRKGAGSGASGGAAWRQR